MSHTFGALGIARALFLWKRHFKLDPLYEQVASLLLVRGSQEEGWFPAARHDQIDSNELSVEDSLSQLQVTKTGNAACLRSAGKSVNLQHIQDLNSQSTKLASAALLTFTREREPSKDDRTQALSSGICYELAELVKRQNDLIKECLRYSSTTDLNNALQISGLVIQCEFLASIIKSEEYVTIELRDIMKEDFTRFIVYSEQLKDAFVAPDMTPGKFSRWASERD